MVCEAVLDTTSCLSDRQVVLVNDFCSARPRLQGKKDTINSDGIPRTRGFEEDTREIEKKNEIG